MSESPYFPPLYGKVDSGECEIASECWCRYKFQRDRRDFSHTSGRCPRLPDQRGFVDKSQRDLYVKTFPLVHAELGEDSLSLSLTLPGVKRSRKVYQAKSGSWYFRDKNEWGDSAGRILHFECWSSREDILAFMKLYGYDYCLFRATIEDYFV